MLLDIQPGIANKYFAVIFGFVLWSDPGRCSSVWMCACVSLCVQDSTEVS